MMNERSVGLYIVQTERQIKFTNSQSIYDFIRSHTYTHSY